MKARYDSYKDSGASWIGDIPAGWECSKLKYYASIRSGDVIQSTEIRDDGAYPIYGGGKIIGYCNTYNMRDNEIIVGRVGSCGHVTLPQTKCWATDNALVISPKNVDLKFIFYVLDSANLNQYNESNAQPLITSTKIKNVSIPLPPLPEQRAIAAYLDQRCRHIDEYTASLQREATLARELKQALIAQAVTRGLDTSVPMKDSGVAWIGQVPAGWEVRRAKYLFANTSAGVWGEDERGDENDIVCFRVADFDYTHGCLKFDKITVRNIPSEQLKGRIVHKGDLLLEKSGGGDLSPVGRVVRCNYEGKATCSNFMQVMTVKDGYSADFIYYYFFAAYSNRVNLLYINQTTGIQNLNMGEFMSQKLPLPPLPEQRAIASYLDGRCAAIDAYVASLEREAALAREMKQREIADAVTGKVRVFDQ